MNDLLGIFFPSDRNFCRTRRTHVLQKSLHKPRLRSDITLKGQKLSHIGKSTIYSLTIHLYLVKISVKWKKTRINYHCLTQRSSHGRSQTHRNRKNTNNTSQCFGQKIAELLLQNQTLNGNIFSEVSFRDLDEKINLAG